AVANRAGLSLFPTPVRAGKGRGAVFLPQGVCVKSEKKALRPVLARTYILAPPVKRNAPAHPRAGAKTMAGRFCNFLSHLPPAPQSKPCPGSSRRRRDIDRLLTKGFPMRRFLPGLLVLLALAGTARAHGILIPTEKKLPPLAMLNHQVNITIEDQVATTKV